MKLCVWKGRCLWPCCPVKLSSPCSIRCAAGGNPCPTAATKSSESSSMSKSSFPAMSAIPSAPGGCRAAAFGWFALQRLHRETFYPCLCWFVGDVGAHSPHLKMARSLTKHFMSLARPSPLGNVSPVQGSAKCFSHPSPLLEQAHSHCFPLLLICGGLFFFLCRERCCLI